MYIQIPMNYNDRLLRLKASVILKDYWTCTFIPLLFVDLGGALKQRVFIIHIIASSYLPILGESNREDQL